MSALYFMSAPQAAPYSGADFIQTADIVDHGHVLPGLGVP